MKNDKKYKGIYLDKKTNTYYVSTTFMTLDGYEVKKCKRGFKTQREANNWKEEQRVFFSKNNLSVTGAIKTPTECLVDRYLQYKKNFCKPITFQHIKSYLKNDFVNYFKDKNLNDLKPTDIQEYYLYIQNKNTKNQSKNVLLAYIHSMIEWFDLMELINGTVARKFKLILKRFEIVEQAKNSYLEPEEIRMLLDSYGTDRKSKMLKLLTCTCLYAGLRHSEARALMYSDIDPSTNTISVTKQLQYVNKKDVLQPFTKNNKVKIVDIPQGLVDMFIEMKQIDDASINDFVFTYNGQVIPDNLSLWYFKQQVKAAGIHDICIHDLRHTYCTMLFENEEIDEKYVSQQMGHSSTDITHRVYEHLTENKRKANKSIIENLIV